jgi:hypothetical protein
MPKPTKVIAELMKAAANMEDHLKKLNPLTQLEEQSLDASLVSLRTVFESWRLHFSK